MKQLRLDATSVMATGMVLLAGCGTHPDGDSPSPQDAAALPPCASTAKRPYADGTFTGDVHDSKHGTVKVTVTTKDGCITSIAETLEPVDGHSKQLQKQAVPLLREAVAKANSSDIDTITGATYTSESYRTSLQSALDKARQ